ncbi:MAG TPA: 16S rRNA (guanine(966)-N(2))-methyltransferase RsmD [Thermoanaerobaculia bacterium]|nr:16S rRNA (guanine(966)-N(2))-methyltransferase RsmD [Thermoanaerobaculia bacterium]
MPALRITAGAMRGRKVTVPPRDVRPTSERARQAFFNIVAERIAGAHFLDLFAGSGIFSFEALSRGAAAATAIDASRQNVAAIAKNAAIFGIEVRTIAADALAGIQRLPGEVFDVIYADPPYDYGGYDDLLMTIDSNLTLAPGAIVAIEHRRNTEPITAEPSRLARTRRAEYGEVWIDFYEAGR